MEAMIRINQMVVELGCMDRFDCVLDVLIDKIVDPWGSKSWQVWQGGRVGGRWDAWRPERRQYDTP
jgi:hypothetical protein